MIRWTLFFFPMLLLCVVPATAAPIDEARKRDAQINAGAVSLAATLYVPAGAPANPPAVVIGHGSAPSTRAMVTFWTNAALKSGLAVLAFDKRGTGKSTGKLEEFEVGTSDKLFGDHAADLAHAVRWLARQPGVDARRIGLMGGSQAGWTMPLAASREPLVKFVIIGEGVPLPAGVEDAHGYYLWATRQDRDGSPALRQVIDADRMSLDYAAQKGYDPGPVIERLTIPMLWMFGLYDTDIPARASIDRIGRLQAAGKRNHHIHIFPFGDHSFVNVFTKERYDVAAVARNWLRDVKVVP